MFFKKVWDTQKRALLTCAIAISSLIKATPLNATTNTTSLDASETSNSSILLDVVMVGIIAGSLVGIGSILYNRCRQEQHSAPSDEQGFRQLA